MSFVRAGKREVGYWVARDHWGRGVATGALSLFLAGFATRPLYAHVAKHNAASLRVLEKCGFQAIGDDPEFSSLGAERVEGVILELR